MNEAAAKVDLTVDHCVIATNDLEADAMLLQKLGFTLTPRSELQQVGVANYLVLFRPNDSCGASFMEIMAPQRPTESLHPAMAQVLTGPSRIRWVVLATENAEASHLALVNQGANLNQPSYVKREWKLSNVESVWPEFKVTFPTFPTSKALPLPFNTCQYFNVKLYHRSVWLKHANGSTVLNAVMVLARDASHFAASYARAWGLQSLPCPQSGKDAWRVHTKGIDLLIFQSSSALQDWSGLSRKQIELATSLAANESAKYLGVQIGSDQLDNTRDHICSALGLDPIFGSTSRGYAIAVPNHPEWLIEWTQQ